MQDKFNYARLQSNLISILVLFLLTLLFFWRVPVEGKVLLSLDMLYTYEPWRSETPGALGIPLWNPRLTDEVRQNYPLLSFVRASWQQGQVPFWNPYNLSGMPVLAAGFHHALYPPILFLLFILPVAQAMSWGIIIHAFLGELFCFWLIRELGSGRIGALVGAISFMFGGLNYWMPAYPAFHTIIWLPLILWTLERSVKSKSWRWTIVGGLVFGLQILAGHLQMVLYSVTGLGFYAVYRGFINWLDDRNVRSLLYPLLVLLLILFLGLGLSAIQWLPLAELLPQGMRSQIDFNLELPSKVILRLFVPDIMGNHIDKNDPAANISEFYLYLGILPLFFLVASAFSLRRRLAWGLIGLGVLVWLVTFKIPPFYQLFAALYPSFKTLGFHRAQVLTALFWAAAAGLGADWVLSARPLLLLKRLLWVGSILLAGLGVYTLGLAFVSKYQARFWWNLPSLDQWQPEPIYLLSSLIFSLTILSADLALLWGWRQAKFSRNVFSGAALSLLVVDVFLANIDYMPAYNPTLLYPSTPSLKFMQNLAAQEPQPFRIMSGNQVLWGDMATVFNLSDIQGYDSFLLKRYSQYIDLTNARIPTHFRIAAFNPRPNKFLDALNVKYYYLPRYKLTEGEWVSLLHQVDKPIVQAEYPQAGNIVEWDINGWTQEVLLAPPDSKISFHGFLKFPTQIETAIAIDPQIWAQPGREILFEVYARSSTVQTEKRLFSQRLTHADPPAWMPVVIDLSEFTNQDIIVSFVTSSPNPTAAWNAGWANPLLGDNSKVELLYYGPNSIYRNKNYLPRAWVIHQLTETAKDNPEAVQTILTNPAFTFATQAVIEGKLSSPILPKTSDEMVEFMSYAPSRSTMKANLSAPGLLVVSDLYYPGWNVYVDGALQPLYATNLIMRGVYLPAGTHQVDFVYEPLSFKMGLYISLGAFGFIIILLALKSIKLPSRLK